MTHDERADFDVLLDFQPELRGFVAGLAEAGSQLALSNGSHVASPPVGLKSRIDGIIQERARRFSPEGRVVCGPDGLVQWVNPAFTAMCGHSLEDLRGRKPGSLLQGPLTDPGAVDRMRRAVREVRGCSETLINYHKNGDTYWVSITLSPVKDEEGHLLWFIARERELRDGPSLN
jgi:PAS domain S-box-containing protein